MRQVNASHAVSGSPNDVIDAIWSGAEWNARWEAIRRFDLRYDDGAHQVADITLSWEDAEVTMEVVRFRTKPGCIEFFCPRPPHPLSYQSGRWAAEGQNGQSVLFASRWIDLAKNPDGSEDAFDLRLGQYADRLSERLSLILPRFANGVG